MASPYPTNMVVATVNPAKSVNLVTVGVNAEQTVTAPGGTVMIVEPMAGDSLKDNLNPIGRLYYSASTMVCVPTSLAQPIGAALGAQAGEKRLRKLIMEEAGFGVCRRAAETPFNLIIEARP